MFTRLRSRISNTNKARRPLLPEDDAPGDIGPPSPPGAFEYPSDSPVLPATLAWLGGVGLVGISLWLYQQEWTSGYRWLALVFFASGLAIFIVSKQAIDAQRATDWSRGWLGRSARWFEIHPWQPICLLTGPALAVLASLAAGDGPRMNSPVVAVGAWVAGIGSVLLGGWQFSKQRERKPVESQAMLIALGLAGLAFAIRGFDTTHIPITLSGDEASAGLSAVGFIKGETNNIFRAGWFSFPSLYYYLQSLPIALFGQTAAALRLTSVLAGSLTVGAVFLAGRTMFGEWAALFGALFLATFHFHNNFSRIGLNNIWDGLWFVTVLGFLWHGWQHANRRSFLLAGLALGFSQYFYVSARVLFAIIPLWVVIAGLQDRSRLKGNMPHLLLMSLAALVTLLPLGIFYARYPNEFWAPLRRVSILGEWLANEIAITGQPAWQILLHQIGLSFQGYAHIPIRMWYSPGTPLLRPLSATMFFVGSSLLLLRLRDARTVLIALWLLSFTVMGGLSESTPAAQRYVAVAPAVALLVGFGLAETTAILSAMWERHGKLIKSLALVAILCIGLDELRFYFLEYTPRSDFGGANTLVAQRLANYLADKPEEWEVLFFGTPRMGYYSISSLPFLAPQIKGLDMNHPLGSPENPQPSGKTLAFVFLPEHEADLRMAQAEYPGGQLLEERTNQGALLYWLYIYPNGADSNEGGWSEEAGRPPYPPTPVDTPVSAQPGGYP